MVRWSKVFVMCIIYICTASNSVINSVRASEDNSTNIESISDVCTTWECMLTVSWIGHSMNSSIDPCDDFYEFTCGRFGKYAEPFEQYNVNIYAEANSEIEYRLKRIIDAVDRTNSSKLERLVKTLYENCMHTDEDGYSKQKVTDFKRELSSGSSAWPVVAKSWDSSAMSYADIWNGLFDVDLQYGLTDLIPRIPRIKRIVQGLDRAILRLGFDNEIVQAWYKYTVDMAVICGADRTQAEIDLKEALRVEIMLADDKVSDADIWVNNDAYINTNLRKLEESYPNLQIRAFLSMHVSRRISDFEQIIVPKGFAHIAYVISTTPKMVLVNLIMWYKVDGYAASLKGELQDRHVEYYRSLGMYEKPIEKWRNCVNTVKLHFRLILSAFYQRAYIDKELITEVKQIAKDVQTNVAKIVEEANWLDHNTIAETIDKIDYIVPILPYRDQYKYDNMLEAYYADLELVDGDLDDTITDIRKFMLNKQDSQSQDSLKLDDWTVYADFFAESASFRPNLNIYNIPVAYLSSDFYNIYRQKYLNYPTLGLEIGHELGHSIDNHGMRYDSHLNEHDWLPPESKKKFNERVQCFIDQAGNYTFDEIGIKLAPHRKLAEIIADNVGVKAAYRAYLEWSSANEAEESLAGLPYTPKQMFWIAVGNSRCNHYQRLELMYDVLVADHPPAKFRVNGVLVNSPEFAIDFGCKSGSRMNPVKKCSLW